jgi:hypothetical protein
VRSAISRIVAALNPPLGEDRSARFQQLSHPFLFAPNWQTTRRLHWIARVLGGEFVSEHLSLAEKPRAPLIPGLQIPRMFSWALPSGELGRLPGEFCQFTNSIRKELSATSISG